MNPYFNKTFFSFFQTLLYRLYGFATGGISVDQLASDEIQILVLAAVAVSSALVGVFLVLKKMTMLANSISHTILVGIVLAYFLTRQTGPNHLPINVETMLIAALMMGIATALITEFVTKVLKLQEDASIGLVFTTLFAIGIISATLLTRSAHVGVEVIMGNVDALHRDDCILVGWILLGNLLLISLFFKEYQIIAFDSALATALGLSVTFFNYLLMVQVSATVVGAFRAVGVLMVLAFITGPALTARLLADSLKRVLAIAAAVGIISALVGVAFARHMLSASGIALSTGGVVVCVIVLFYLLALLLSPKQGLLMRARLKASS